MVLICRLKYQAAAGRDFPGTGNLTGLFLFREGSA